ncbi:IclR family transcriptional regulator domain-containing protein [Sciscionella marina]|uniref:IclR family transcriptional regulator domain-containing protein n=1 Tax=Sciscionella marina TaxID=508770 RepID=UPI0003654CA7|nr:helix-turn-helix domain-containing protein [Sciscionella marina]
MAAGAETSEKVLLSRVHGRGHPWPSATVEEVAISIKDEPRSVTPPSTLGRLSLVMDLFRDRPRLTLTDVSRGTGIPRTSTLRMLDHLVRIGWLRRRGAEYELGDALAELGALALYRSKFDLVVAPLLRELHRVTGCVVHLGALEGDKVRYLEKVGVSPDWAGVAATWAGACIPAQSSAIGKALLAAARRPPGAHGAPSRGARPQPETVFVECGAGFGCIGVQVGDLGGTAVGVSVTGPADRLRFDQRYAAPVQIAAAAIAQYLTSAQSAPGPTNHRSV